MESIIDIEKENGISYTSSERKNNILMYQSLGYQKIRTGKNEQVFYKCRKRKCKGRGLYKNGCFKLTNSHICSVAPYTLSTNCISDSAPIVSDIPDNYLIQGTNCISDSAPIVSDIPDNCLIQGTHCISDSAPIVSDIPDNCLIQGTHCKSDSAPIVSDSSRIHSIQRQFIILQ